MIPAEQHHRLSELDSANRTAVCSLCGPVHVYSKGPRAWQCGINGGKRRRARLRAYTTLVSKEYCWKCGFTPEDECQLDVDHIDGDNKNNALINLQVLCANCHRLKTRRNNEFHGMKYRRAA